ncbi:hypothetical protein [Enterobacter ludwigii]|uniref:hypothetical protein n=1 Tax=Enterobacter ludwigii TaxID=299767 RepID=UPI001C8BB379|nr:hypothetical protein [Enterobacter ludwigii]
MMMGPNKVLVDMQASKDLESARNAVIDAASKPEWDGEGLPPVGCECMVRGEIGDDGWYECKVIAHTFFDGYNCAVFQTESTVSCSSEGNFRPIRSEADRRRDEAAKGLIEYLDKETDIDNVFSIKDVIGFYDAIAAGKIPHIRID